jgi:Ca2+-binding EF-hand superfamily protein
MSLGIENLKPTIKVLAQLISTISKADSNKDGKIDTAEMFGIVQVFVMKLISIYGSLGQALLELKDLDSKERTELIKAFNESFDLENDLTEEIIKEWLVTIDQVATLGAKTLEHFKK